MLLSNRINEKFRLLCVFDLDNSKLLFFTVLFLPCIFFLVIISSVNENKPMDELLQVAMLSEKSYAFST